MLRVRTVWTGVGGSPWYSNLYLDGDAVDVQTALDQVITFIGALADYQGPSVDWVVEDSVSIIDPVSGQPTGVATGTGDSGSGSNTGDLLPTSTQALIRFNTGEFQNGRQVLGHMYVPGLVEGLNSSLGTLDTSTADALATLAADLSTTPGNLTQLVWSRKNGAAYPVTGTTVTNKWAVLRSRRD